MSSLVTDCCRICKHYLPMDEWTSPCARGHWNAKIDALTTGGMCFGTDFEVIERIKRYRPPSIDR